MNEIISQTCGQNYIRLSFFNIRTKEKKLFHVLLAYEFFNKFFYKFIFIFLKILYIIIIVNLLFIVNLSIVKFL